MAKLIEFDQETKVKLGNEIVDSWHLDNADRNPWLADLAKWLDAYQGRHGEKNIPFEGASNLHVPVTATVVETIHPRIMAALARPKPIVGFRPQEESDYELARARETFLDWSLREEINIFPVLDRTVLNTLVYGLQFVKANWELRIRKVRDKHEFSLDTPPQQMIEALLGEDAKFAEAIGRVGGGKLEAKIKDHKVEFEVEKGPRNIAVFTERDEIIYDAPTVTLIAAEDISVNSDTPFDLQLADHINHRYWMTYDQIKREVKKGIFAATKEELAKIKALEQPDTGLDDNTSEIKYVKDSVTGVNAVSKQSKPDKIELIDSYRKYDVDDDGYDEEVIITIPKGAPSVILRAVRLEEVFRHGYRPFVCFYFNPAADSIYAIGIPQILEGTQQEFNIIHNQRTDAGFIANTPFGVYVPAAGFNPEKMPIEPGYMYPVDDVNAVKWYSPPHNPAWGFQEEGLLWTIVERRTKVNDLSIGRVGESQGAARTASGVNVLASQQATGFDIYIRRFQESFKLLVQQILALYQQYMPPGKEVRILGKQGDPITVVTRDDIRGNMDMEFTGNALSTDRQIEREAMTFLAQSVLAPASIGMLLQLGISTPQGIAEWYRKLLSSFDLTGVERIIQIPEVVEMLVPDEVVAKVLQGEQPKARQGEDHQGIIAALQQLLASPEAIGLPAEIRVSVQKQIQARMNQAQQEQMAQMMQQIAMLQAMNSPQAMAAQGPGAPQGPGQARPPGVGGQPGPGGGLPPAAPAPIPFRQPAPPPGPPSPTGAGRLAY